MPRVDARRRSAARRSAAGLCDACHADAARTQMQPAASGAGAARIAVGPVARRRDGEDDVPAGDRQVRVRLGGAAVERLDGHLCERDEVALGCVEYVRYAAAVAVPREREHALDAVPVGLDPDPFAPLVDARVLVAPLPLA